MPGPETKEVEIEVDEEEVAVVSMKVMTKETKVVNTENIEKMGTEDSKVAEREIEEKKAVDKTLAGSGAGKLGAGPEITPLKSVMKKYRFVLDTLLTNLGNGYELEAGSVLTEKSSLALIDQPYKTRSAQGQWSSARDVFPKRDMEDPAKVVDSIMAPGAHGHIFCSDLEFFTEARAFVRRKRRYRMWKGIWREKRYGRYLRWKTVFLCISSSLGSAIVTLVEEISSKRPFRTGIHF